MKIITPSPPSLCVHASRCVINVCGRVCIVCAQTENFNGIMSSSGLDPTNPGSAEAMAKGDPVSAYLQVMTVAQFGCCCTD